MSNYLTREEIELLREIIKGDKPTDDWTDEALAKIDALCDAARAHIDLVAEIERLIKTEGWCECCNDATGLKNEIRRALASRTK